MNAQNGPAKQACTGREMIISVDHGVFLAGAQLERRIADYALGGSAAQQAQAVPISTSSAQHCRPAPEAITIVQNGSFGQVSVRRPLLAI
jgi:hypothetical protein